LPTTDGAKTALPFEALIDQTATTLQGEVTLAYKLRAGQLKAQPVEPTMTGWKRKVSPAGRASGDDNPRVRARRLCANLTPEQQAGAQALARFPAHALRAEPATGQKKTRWRPVTLLPVESIRCRSTT